MGEFGVDFGDAFVVGAEVEFVKGGEHAMGFVAAELADAETEAFAVVGGRDDGAWGEPDGQHASVDVGGTADDLDGGGAGGFESVRSGFGSAEFGGGGAGVDLTKVEMGALNRFGRDNLDDVGLLVFGGEIFDTLDFDEARADEADEVLVVEISREIDVVFDGL